MPGGWLKQHDVRRLADGRAEFDCAIPLAELPSAPGESADSGKSVHVRASFGRERDLAVAEVRLDGELTLTCQRCLGPMRLVLASHSRVAVVDSEQAAARVPAEWETFLATEGRVSLAELASEELLLALPVVPLHERPEQCQLAETEQPQAEPVASEPATTTRPFANLGALLKRS